MSCHTSHATMNMLKLIKKPPVRIQGRLIFQIRSENIKKKNNKKEQYMLLHFILYKWIYLKMHLFTYIW